MIASAVYLAPRSVARVREGAYTTLHDYACEINQAGRDCEEHTRVRRRLLATWQLLDTIGWTPNDRLEMGVQLDQDQYRAPLRDAVKRILPLTEYWLNEFQRPIRAALTGRSRSTYFVRYTRRLAVRRAEALGARLVFDRVIADACAGDETATVAVSMQSRFAMAASASGPLGGHGCAGI